jgi:hypothetical protein
LEDIVGVVGGEVVLESTYTILNLDEMLRTKSKMKCVVLSNELTRLIPRNSVTYAASPRLSVRWLPYLGSSV